MRDGETTESAVGVLPAEQPRGQPVSGTTEPIVLARGNVFCVVNRRGDIAPAGARDLGLFFEDTRHLSRFELVVSSGAVTVLSAESTGSSTAQIDLTLSGSEHDGYFAEPQNFLHLRRRQLLDEGEFVERLSATNHLRRPVALEIAIAVEADFADIFEVRGAVRARRGALLPPRADRDRLELAYEGVDATLYRTVVRFIPEPTSFAGSVARYQLHLDPGETTVLEMTVVALRGTERALPEWRPFDVRLRGAASAQRAFTDGATRLTCDNNRFEALLGRALSDIQAMRLALEGGRSMVGAGIPWFSAPFGRDAIITSLACLSVAPDLARETLRTLAHYQGRRDDPWREEEPGKIMHELRRGELARAGEVPHSPYYGTIDATPLWLVLLGETFRWTGDEALVEELLPHAERALEWIDRRIERGGGLVRYERTHGRGLENQGWKDSRDGVSFPDGTIAQPPIALVEVQGYVVAAFEALAQLARHRGDARRAARLRERAVAMRRRIDHDFWVDETRYFALAIDGEGRRVPTITSNPGHLAFCRAAHPERLARLGDVLLSDEMYTGWGIRTLARGQAVYNPLSYHNGTVWPHDNALCAFGLALTGQGERVRTLFEGLYAASLHFRDLRLPELFCGMARGEGDSLVRYPVSCSPQAWASAAFFLLLQSSLGIRPDAEHHRVAVRNPRLPDFLHWFELGRMRVGKSFVTLHFERTGRRTHVDLVAVEGEPGLKVAIEIG